ncbi:MAG: calcium-translocating P-type ATPase, PMCA-type [Chitinispirillales bacterium]|jgi:calcium-translocating P-type ATPase|nr:calcium-translocating P-type ATPase, PMCA-type [Chitinispirillales bacterium]
MQPFGLTDSQAAESKARSGDNRLTELARESFFDKLKANFGDPMIKILLVALAINAGLVIGTQTGFITGEKIAWYEPVGIAVAILIATLVSTFSEYRNENAFQKLQEDASRIQVKTYRNGVIVELDICDLVCGDAILLQPGDKIPADGVVVDGGIKVDQSALNGESKEAAKKAIPDGYEDDSAAMDFLHPHKVFRGAVVCGGNAVMRVGVVGDKSVYGQIAKELQTGDDRETPLKVKLRALARSISKFGYAGGVSIALALMFKFTLINNGFDPARIAAYCANWGTLLNDAMHAFMLVVIIIVMAVPEGLPLMIAIVSALNMGKMLKDNVLVRKLAGIETAGSLNFLFSDKTGTITKGKLEVVAFIDGALNEYKSYGGVDGGLKKYLSLSILQNTDSVISGEGAQRKIVGGNATERAVLAFSGGDGEAVNAKTIGKIPFNSTNKYSATSIEGDYSLTLIKGAPEKILDRCKYYYDNGGQKKEYAGHQQLNKNIDALAERAIRVVALAVSEKNIIDESLPEGGWTLVGVMGIRDEVRPESVTAIKEVIEAGLNVVMITGDRKETAAAIAKDAGLMRCDSDAVLTSDEFAARSDGEIKAMLKDIRVVARALPADKSRLVRITQEMNYVVGMTGDGVNDSPALKKADVGFAMGGGTEVAKEASDIVILDDNFNSIDKAVLYGRTIFNNIRKFIVFQLTINVSAVLINFIAPLLGRENPLTIIQILWINLIMDTLAALAFGGEAALKRYMKEPPKKRADPIVSGRMWKSIFTGSAWIFALSLLFLFCEPFKERFFAQNAGGQETVYTAYFTFFVLIAMFNAFNARTDSVNVLDNICGNKNFLRILGLVAIIQIALVYTGGEIFRCHGLSITQWGVVTLCAASVVPVDMARKALAGAGSRG